MKEKKAVFTTGEIAEVCGVTHRTVVNWIQRGEIKAYKLPGKRGDNRIPRQELLAFMDRNGLPIPPEIVEPPPTPERELVLIVDDEQSMVNAISRVLVRAGYRTIHALDGFQAGILFEKHKPKLVSLDLQMPKMDGLAVLQNIKASSEMKVIIISGATPTMLSRAKELGADAVLTKPFENDDLVRTASELLHRS